MDQEPEDWEEKKRIKAEIRKAEMAGDQENKGNLTHLGAEEFAARKGFSREPEDFRRSGEKLSDGAAALAVLGLLGAMIMKFAIGGGLVVFDIIIGAAGVLGAAGVVAVVIYHQQTGKNLKHVLSASILSIIIALIWIFIRPWI
ncbi:hypothetical protein IJ162_02860 [Candidatus Saccharibacteria bacterium]|nr:hypothetical protein [Candidatus Saccharibacteria bacterium]